MQKNSFYSGLLKNLWFHGYGGVIIMNCHFSRVLLHECRKILLSRVTCNVYMVKNQHLLGKWFDAFCD